MFSFFIVQSFYEEIFSQYPMKRETFMKRSKRPFIILKNTKLWKKNMTLRLSDSILQSVTNYCTIKYAGFALQYRHNLVLQR